MFKNRAIQVKMIKDSSNSPDVAIEVEETYLEKVVYTKSAVKDLAWEGMKLIAVYIALDTTREVLIALAKK